MKLDCYISNIIGMQEYITPMALGTSLLQYSLGQENAEWVAIVSLIDHHQTKI